MFIIYNIHAILLCAFLYTHIYIYIYVIYLSSPLFIYISIYSFINTVIIAGLPDSHKIKIKLLFLTLGFRLADNTHSRLYFIRPGLNP